MILSDEQSRIVELSKGGHIVLAPPGTGKTELLARRAEHALKIGIPQEKMVCLTFTNRAAKEMKDRIDERNPGNAIFVGNMGVRTKSWTQDETGGCPCIRERKR